MRKFFATALVAAAFMAGVPAHATPMLIGFSLSGSGYSGSGVIGYDDAVATATLYPCATCASGPGYLITSVTGTINAQTITGVAPLATIAGNNNLIFPASTPSLDFGDFGFETASASYNAFNANSYPGRTGYYLAVTGGQIFDNPINFSLRAVSSAIPEPATWTVMLLGFLGVGFMMRGSRRKAVAKAA